jgi:hypothetical protein
MLIKPSSDQAAAICCPAQHSYISRMTWEQARGERSSGAAHTRWLSSKRG